MKNKFLYDEICELKNNISLYRYGDYVGAFDEIGNIIVEVNRRYDDIKVFDTKGFMKYREGSRWGLLDSRGNVLCVTKYAEIDEFYHGCALATKLVDGTLYYGFINTNGSEITKFIYRGAYPFKLGYGLLIKDGILYYVDRYGKVSMERK